MPPASSKIANEVRSSAIAKMGGLLNCQEWASATGRNSGSSCMRKFTGRYPHHPARRGRLARADREAKARSPGPELRYLLGTPRTANQRSNRAVQRDIAGRM